MQNIGMRGTRQHLAGLDGLRGLAALSVLLYHVSNVLSPEIRRSAPVLVDLLHQGLTLFFVLSGFLLFLGFAERLVAGDALPRLPGYALARILRIWPAYLVVLVVVDVVGLAFVWPKGVGRLSSSDLITDLTLLHSLSPETLRTGLEVSWTLTVELTFYALLPLLASLAARIAPGSGAPGVRWLRAVAPVVALLALGAVGRLWAAWVRSTPGGLHGWGHDWTSVVSRSLLMQADTFAAGMIAALVVVAARHGLLGARGHLVATGGATIVVLAAATVFVGDRHAALRGDLVAAAFAALVVAVLLPSTRQARGVVARLLDWRPIRFLGLVSYSLYLWHLPVIRALQHWAPRPDPGWSAYLGQSAIVVAISVALAALTYRFVERPALALRSRRGTTKVAATSAAPATSDVTASGRIGTADAKTIRMTPSTSPAAPSSRR
jgi:peptidoglycan/LPS O-acetylase OafA/YrhL